MKKFTKYIVACLAFSIIFLASANISSVKSAGRVYYISPNGSDTTGSGTSTKPWKTFKKGISILTYGDTLKAFGGTYNESVTVPYTKNGTQTAPIIIESVSGQKVVVRYDTSFSQAFKINGNYIHLKNIEINGTATDRNGSSQCLLISPSSSNKTNQIGVVIDKVKVYGCNSHGIQISGRYNSGVRIISSATVQNSEIYNANRFTISKYNTSGGWPSALKIGRDGQNIVLKNNTVHDNYGEGIAVTRGTNVQVLDNTVYNNYAVGIYVDNSVNVNIERNFSYCYDMSDPRIILRNGQKPTGISVAEEHYTDAPLWGNKLSGIKIINNVVYNCGKAFGYFGNENGTGGFRNSIVSNNMFYLKENIVPAVQFNDEPQDSYQFKNNIIKSKVSLAYISSTSKDLNFDYNYWVDALPPTVFRGPNDINSNLANLNLAGSPSFDKNAFKIGSNSLARNKGMKYSSPNTILLDANNNLRDNYPDIGPFEYILPSSILSGYRFANPIK